MIIIDSPLNILSSACFRSADEPGGEDWRACIADAMCAMYAPSGPQWYTQSWAQALYPRFFCTSVAFLPKVAICVLRITGRISCPQLAFERLANGLRPSGRRPAETRQCWIRGPVNAQSCVHVDTQGGEHQFGSRAYHKTSGCL